MFQERHGFDAVNSHVYVYSLIYFAKRFFGEANISRTIFDQKNFDGFAFRSKYLHEFLFSWRAGWRGTLAAARCQFARRIKLRLLWQSDRCQPKIVDALDQTLERVQLHGLAQVAIRVELIALHNVSFRVGSGQDHSWNRFQNAVCLDL